MDKVKKANDYKRYGFDDNVPYQSCCERIKDYLDDKFAGVNGVDQKEIHDTITSSINESMSGVNCQLHGIKHDIHCSTHVIVDEIHEHAGGGCQQCLVEKISEKLDDAVNRVNAHTDERFDGVNFEQKFSDLNDQVAEILGKV